MIVDLDNKTRIRSTSACWQLEQESIVKGKESWKPIAYYGSFAAAVSGAANREIRTTHTHGLAESIAAVEAILAKYQGLLQVD